MLGPRNDQRERLFLLPIPRKVWPLTAQHSKPKRNIFVKEQSRSLSGYLFLPFLRKALKVIPLTNQGLHSPILKDLCHLTPISLRIMLNLLNMKSNAVYILIYFLVSFQTILPWHLLVLHQTPYFWHHVIITSG